MDQNAESAAIAGPRRQNAPPEQIPGVQVFTGDPTGLHRLATLDKVAAMPDETVVIWNDDLAGRQAGVLATEDGRERVVRPISIGYYEDDFDLQRLTPPVWVVTFDDPPDVQ